MQYLYRYRIPFFLKSVPLPLPLTASSKNLYRNTVPQKISIRVVGTVYRSWAILPRVRPTAYNSALAWMPIKRVAIKGVNDCIVKLVETSSIMSDSQFLPLSSFLFFRNFRFSPFIQIFRSPTQKVPNLRFDGVHHVTRIWKTFQVIEHIVAEAILTNQISGGSKNYSSNRNFHLNIIDLSVVLSVWNLRPGRLGEFWDRVGPAKENFEIELAWPEDFFQNPVSLYRVRGWLKIFWINYGDLKPILILSL